MKKTAWIVFVLVVPALLIYLHFTKIFACPACYLFLDGGDGLKNYYTLLYYVQHDAGFHFSGMNYPYGENIIYTDNQPVLALTLQWIDRHITDLDRHVIGILNMLLLVSIYLAVLVSYSFLRRLGTGRWWSLGSAMCIIFLSPQLLRLHGHYGLAYVIFIPLLLWLIDRIVRDSRRRYLWAAGTIVLGIVMSLTHLYFLLIGSVIVASFALMWWWYHRSARPLIRPVLFSLLAAALIPAIVILGIKSATDNITDRPVEPWGIDFHNVNLESTFLPFIPPFDKAWSALIDKEKPIIEKIAYTGLIGLLMLPAFLFFLFRRGKKEFVDEHVRTFGAVAIISWLLAAGVFYQNGFRFLWDIVPMLKQFRGMGRFGFAFYYLYMFSVSYLLWKVYLKLRTKELKSIGIYLLAAIFVYWGFESWLHLRAIREPVFNVNTFLADSKTDYVPLLTQAGYAPDDFQAILQFPLVVIGNETMGVTRGFWTLREGMHASIETGLPIIDYAMSRTSVSQGLDLIELISSPHIVKRRAENFDDRPLLLLCEEEFMIPAEKQWMDRGTKIGHYKTITLYKLDVSHFKNVTHSALVDTAITGSCGGWFDGFENDPCDTVMTGKGAMCITQTPHSLWSYSDTVGAVRDWNISFWAHIDHYKNVIPAVTLVEKDAAGKEVLRNSFSRDNVPWSEVYGNWLQVNLPMRTQGGGHHYELLVENAGTVVDNLLISPQHDTCVVHEAGITFINNVPVTEVK